jgi:hypothetical protein
MSRNLRSSRIWAAALLLPWLAVVALVAILVGQSRRHGDCAARLAAVETESKSWRRSGKRSRGRTRHYGRA